MEPGHRDTILSEKQEFQQQPGLALAASKIFFSDKRYAISGFGEFNYVPVQTNVDKGLGDLELYYSGLYRYSTFFGYKITDKLIWNSEFQLEFIHDGDREAQHEIMVEAFVDYLFRDYLKARIGFFPLTIGYVNNNDEPIMFYAVNRSEVERLIIPSTWIEFGTMLYGNISNAWNYTLGFSQGLNSKNYLSGTWIRQGREIRFDLPRAISVSPQLNYIGVKDLTLSVSGYYGDSGQGETVILNDVENRVRANIVLGSAYAKYDWNNFRLLALGTYGKLSDSDKIYELTKQDDGIGQVLGENVYGYLFEAGCDVLPYIRKRKPVSSESNWFYDPKQMKLSFFGRYERLNTHQQVNQHLRSLPRTENNLAIWTTGLNFNSRENIVFKANYQYRKNKFEGDLHPSKNLVETGIGFIF
ncbi:hypothetical protein [Olivibacter sp. SDN3]|uniref:hypothetical protein n=1 Tax=Olivibacter sp. SDN3 TaxID=2764720 RepID=UPI001C9E5B00|nr:hypothetical protein [Olivibacter sp. SDN3]